MRSVALVLVWLATASACGGAQLEESTTSLVIEPPSAVAKAMIDALIDEDYDATAALVDERHIAFLVAIERGTSSEVAGMLRSGVPARVRRDFWESFADTLPTITGESIGRVQVGSVVAEFNIGGRRYAALDMFVADGRAEWIMRLTETGWVLDLMATFGSGVLPNLRAWFAVIGADTDAAFIRDEFESEIPSVRAGLQRLPLGELSDEAQFAADELLIDFGG